MSITLRAAAERDSDRLLEWRNDAATRASSFSERRIRPEEHAAWLARTLRDDGTRLLIVEEGARPVGQLRLHRLDAHVAEIHIGLAPDARGRGIGTEALKLAPERAFALLGVREVVARVKRDNVASLNAFRAAGFTDARRNQDVIELVRPCEQPRA